MPEASLPRIPWAISTEVVYYKHGEPLIELKQGTDTALIDLFNVKVEHDSKEQIKLQMTKSRELTSDLAAFLVNKPEYGASEDEWIRAWIKGTPAPMEAPGPEDVLEWVPGIKHWQPPRSSHRWKAGHLKHSETMKGWDNWAGSEFAFYHFVDDDEELEGAVIKWEDEPNYEVWLGNFVDFIHSQEEADMEDPDTWADWNRGFENGFIWAMHFLGVFNDPDIPVPVEAVLQRDPDLLYEELVQDLLPNLDQYPTGIREAVNAWLVRRRIEAEQAGGQGYIWPDIYPENQ